MASTSVAAAASNARAAISAPHPSSPFAELLRRSRFATFDPKIRQTYSTPPAYAHRGNWGLKRPLALRRRNSFITLPAPFEDRAQYIEWRKAESEVRFIRRFEEMEVRPQIRPQTPWYNTLGREKASHWMLDSEFCYNYEGPEAEESSGSDEKTEVRLQKEHEEGVRKEIQQKQLDSGLGGFGKKGEGNYGHRRPRQESNLAPNINAMTPREFERYVRRLRELRPKFQQYLKQVSVENQDPELARKSLFRVAQLTEARYYRTFLEAHTADQFADAESHVIQQRPHQIGGLIYHHPSALHTQFFAKPQPGFLLQSAEQKRDPSTNTNTTVFIASFGGMTPVVHNRGDKVPLFDTSSETGIGWERLAPSIANMRIDPGTVFLMRPPLSVGVNPSGLNRTMITSQASIVGARPSFGKSNPYPPGSMEYVDIEQQQKKTDAPALMPVPRRKFASIPHKPAPTNKVNTKLIATLQETVKDGPPVQKQGQQRGQGQQWGQGQQRGQ